MPRWHIPDRIYEPLPYIYVSLGLVGAIATGNALGVAGGVALCSAGITIRHLRKTYRQAKAAEQAEIDPFQALLDESAGLKMANLVWKPSFNVGHDLIDRQHRRLFVVSNDLINHLVAGKPKDDIEFLLDDLILDIKEHFRAEEDIMEKLGNPISNGHKENHAKLLSDVRKMREQFHFDGLPASELIGFITAEVVASHIMKEDLHFSESIRKRAQQLGAV